MKAYRFVQKVWESRARAPWKHNQVSSAWSANKMHRYINRVLNPFCLIFVGKRGQYFTTILLQNAEIPSSLKKLFLTGIEASGLAVILPPMERKVRGERG